MFISDMKKLVPLKGYVLITFENDGMYKLPTESLQNEKSGAVVALGKYDLEFGDNTSADILVGDKIFFTNITGRIIVDENNSYAFINYADIIGKELK